MIRRPPKATHTDTLSPYTSLFRSVGKALRVVIIGEQLANLKVGLPNGSSERLDTYVGPDPRAIFNEMLCLASLFIFIMLIDERGGQIFQRFPQRHNSTPIDRTLGLVGRPEERGVGNECVGTLRYGGAP